MSGIGRTSAGAAGQIYQQILSSTGSRINQALSQASQIQAQRKQTVSQQSEAGSGQPEQDVTQDMLDRANQESASMRFSFAEDGETIRAQDSQTGAYLTSMSSREFVQYVNRSVSPTGGGATGLPQAETDEPPSEFEQALSAANQSEFTQFTLQDNGSVRVTDRNSGRFLTTMSAGELVNGYASGGVGSKVDTTA